MIPTSLLFEYPASVAGLIPFHTDRRGGVRGFHHLPPTPLVPRATSSARPARHAESLGAASLGGRWQWADAGAAPAAPVAQIPPAAPDASVSAPQVAAVRVSPLLLEEMSAAATTQGRSLSDIWAEAAREWLRRHAHEDEPQPPTPAAAALAVPMPTRSWAAIDSVLAALRRSPDSAA